MTPFTFKNLSLHYTIEGEGETLIFIHGFMEDHTMWSEIKKPFASSFQIITIDLPCHGKSRYDGKTIRIDEMATALHVLLDELSVENPYVVGHSLGGYVGLELLELKEAQVTLLHSNFWEDSEDKKKDRDRVIDIVMRAKEIFIMEAIPHLFAEENKSACKSSIEALVERAKSIPATEIAACSAALRDRKSKYELFESHDMTMIHGELDPILPAELLTAELAKIDYKVTLFRLPNCGHMSIWEKPEQLIDLLKQILIP